MEVLYTNQTSRPSTPAMPHPDFEGQIQAIKDTLELVPEALFRDRERIFKIIALTEKQDVYTVRLFANSCNVRLRNTKHMIPLIRQLRKIGNETFLAQVMKLSHSHQTEGRAVTSRVVQKLLQCEFPTIDLEEMVRQYNRALAKVVKAFKEAAHVDEGDAGSSELSNNEHPDQEQMSRSTSPMPLLKRERETSPETNSNSRRSKRSKLNNQIGKDVENAIEQVDESEEAEEPEELSDSEQVQVVKKKNPDRYPRFVLDNDQYMAILDDPGLEALATYLASKSNTLSDSIAKQDG